MIQLLNQKFYRYFWNLINHINYKTLLIYHFLFLFKMYKGWTFMSGNRMTILVKKSQDRYYQNYFTLFITSVIHRTHICNSFRIMLLFIPFVSFDMSHFKPSVIWTMFKFEMCVAGRGAVRWLSPRSCNHLNVSPTSIGEMYWIWDAQLTVKIIFIENSPMSCGESLMLRGTKGAVLYMTGK